MVVCELPYAHKAKGANCLPVLSMLSSFTLTLSGRLALNITLPTSSPSPPHIHTHCRAIQRADGARHLNEVVKRAKEGKLSQRTKQAAYEAYVKVM